MNIHIKTQTGGYDIVLERGALAKAGELLKLDRRVLVVTDDGVPSIYAEKVAKQCKASVIITIPQGEQSKQVDNWSLLLETMVNNNFTRSDCVVAVGGGVVGDLSGFAASTYMRGIDFYNIPTTILSQVDSSIGGKTAVDFLGYKNLVGAFYPPKKVIIDPETLKTLPERQISNGFSEAVKMALTSDKELFEIFENEDIKDNDVIDKIIYRSLLIKKNVVELDECESGLRRILNFGHTLAHAIESINQLKKYYHGECVAIGMIPMCDTSVQKRLLPVLKKLNLPTVLEEDYNALISACKHDKKTFGDSITVVTVKEVGSYTLETLTFEDFSNLLRKVAFK